MKTPNPERIYAVVASILERRYSVKIEYTLSKIEGGNYEQNRD
jgi:hypothetical protein